MLFDRHQTSLEAGSPMEFLFLGIWRMRQDIEFQKSRSLVQALLSQKDAHQEHIEKAFKDLRTSFFPYEENRKERELQDMREVLNRDIQRGALRVTPMHDPSTLRRRSTVTKRGDQNMKDRMYLEEVGRLRKLDRSPVREAKNRKERGIASLTKRGRVP